MSTRQFTINVNVSGNADANVKQVNTALRGTARDARKASSAVDMMKGALGAVGLTLSAKAAIDLAKAVVAKGEAWESARSAVESTTGSLSAATAAIEEAQAATDGLVSKTDSAVAVNVFFKNGMAETGAEAGKLAQTGQILSSVYEAQGATFEKYIRFISSGNIALADNFNLNQQMIDTRSTLIQETEGLSKAEADLQARMQLLNEAAEGYTETMPEAAKASMELKASSDDLAAALGETLLPAVTAVKTELVELAQSGTSLIGRMDALSTSLVEQAASYDEYNTAVQTAKKGNLENTAFLEHLTKAQYDQVKATQEQTEITEKYTQLMGGRTPRAISAVIEATNKLTAEQIKNRAAIEELNTRYVRGATLLKRNNVEALARAEKVNAQVTAFEQDRERNYAAHVGRLATLDRSAASAATSHASTMAGISRSAEAASIAHSQRIADIRQQIERAANAGIESRRRQLSRSLESLAERHGDKIKSLRDRLSDLESDYTDRSRDDAEEHQDDVDDLTEDHTSRRNEIIRALGRVRNATELRELRQRLADEDSEFAQRMERMERDRQQELARSKREHAQKVQGVKDQITEEEAEYLEQQEKLKSRAAEDIEIKRSANAQRVADLRASLDQENAAYGRQQADFNRRLEEEKASYAAFQADLARQRNEEMTSFAAQQAAIREEINTTIGRVTRLAEAWRRQTEAIRAARSADYEYDTPYNIPGYQGGTSFVPETGLALLHKGEAVVPAGKNAGGGGRRGAQGAQGLTIILNYSPVISLADRYEAEEKLAPYIANALRQQLGVI